MGVLHSCVKISSSEWVLVRGEFHTEMRLAPVVVWGHGSVYSYFAL